MKRQVAVAHRRGTPRQPPSRVVRMGGASVELHHHAVVVVPHVVVPPARGQMYPDGGWTETGRERLGTGEDAVLVIEKLAQHPISLRPPPRAATAPTASCGRVIHRERRPY